MNVCGRAADDAILRLRDVTVDLPIFSPRGRSLQLAVLNLAVGGKLSERVGRTVYVRALDRVSFDVYCGDRIGLLGHNGSGKSTLLKVLSSIYLPTSGQIQSSVRVVPLLDFNLGVDDDMTGIEAIRVGCMLRGISKDRMAEALADICEFTELGEFLNLPIRTYSAGMRARLAFGTATAVRPEAIAIDENLSTGDAQFIKKARLRARSLSAAPRSCSWPAIRKTCCDRFARRGSSCERERSNSSDRSTKRSSITTVAVIRMLHPLLKSTSRSPRHESDAEDVALC